MTKASLSTPPSSPRKTLASRSFYYKLLCFGRRLCWTRSQKGVIDIIVSAAEESGRSLSIIVFLGTKPRPTNSTVCFLVIARRPRRLLVWRATVDKHNVHKTIQLYALDIIIIICKRFVPGNGAASAFARRPSSSD